MIKQGFHFIVLLASIYLIFAITDDRILAVFNKCKESDSTQKYPALDEIFEPDWNTTDPDIKCFVMCLGVELGEVDPKTGGAILEGILKNDYEEVEKIKEVFPTCTKDVTDNACETAYKQFKCFIKSIST